MKKTKLFKISTLLLFTVIACNKKNITSPSETKNPVPDHKEDKLSDDQGTAVSERMYNLTPQEIKTSINFLTASTDLQQSASKNAMPESNLLPDSSVWVLEAALNYHFDTKPPVHEVSLESLEFSAPLTFVNGAVWVTPADLKRVYNQFKSSISQLSAGPKKVKIIDIKANIQNGQINYKGSVVLYIGTTPVPCEPYTTQSMAWSKYYMGLGFCCPATTLQDAPTELAKKLNNGCPAFDPGCAGGGPFGYYWVNVNSSPQFNGYNAGNFSTWFPSPTGKLFYTYKTAQLVACNGICLSLSAGFLNQYFNGCKSLAASVLPAGTFPANYYIGAYWNPINAGVWQEGGWVMDFKYAVPVCKVYEQ